MIMYEGRCIDGPLKDYEYAIDHYRFEIQEIRAVEIKTTVPTLMTREHIRTGQYKWENGVWIWQGWKL